MKRPDLITISGPTVAVSFGTLPCDWRASGLAIGVCVGQDQDMSVRVFIVIGSRYVIRTMSTLSCFDFDFS
jgi:hypothetical protein